MITIIAKVTHKCNLNCRYCCVGEGDDGYIMSDTTLEALFATAAKYFKNVSIIWHGGEPLVAGINFYKKVVKLQLNHPECRFRNSIQTNGTLLTPEHIQFFKLNHFHIGFSLDGCEISHNSNRPYKGGSPSFNAVLNSIRLVEKEYNRPCGAICIINRTTANYIKEIYDFAKESKIKFKFNPQYRAGRAIINNDLELSNEEVAQSLIKLFDLWYHTPEGERAPIPQFQSFVKSIIAISQGREGKAYDCGFGKECQNRFIAVSPQGDIYPCGKFVGEEEYKYGNIAEFDWGKYLTNSKRQELLDYSNKANTECQECRFKTMCNGGCPNDSHLFYGDLKHPNPFCDAYKTLFEHIESLLLSDAKCQDVYISKIDSEDRFIVYSPLRHLIFHTDNSGAQAVRKYLSTSKLSSNDEGIVSNIMHMTSRLPEQVDTYPFPAWSDISFLLNSTCNLSCEYCYAKKYHIGAHLKFNQIKACIDYARNHNRHHGKINFTFVGGGEPFIDADIIWLSVKFIKENIGNAGINIVTNGTIIDNDIINAVKKYNIHLTISFDILPEIHNRNRSNSYDKVAANLHMLLNSGIVPSIRTTINRHSVDLMSQMVKHINKFFRGIKEVHLEMVDNESELNDEMFLSNYLNSFENAYLLGITYGINVKNQLTMSLDNLRSRFCLGDICLCPDGSLTACQRVYDKHDTLVREYFIGRVDDQDQISIDNETLLRTAKNFNDKSASCKKCIAQYHCAGTCPHVKSKLRQDCVEKYCDYVRDLTSKHLYYKYFGYSH